MNKRKTSRVLQDGDGNPEACRLVLQEARSAIQPDAVLQKLNMHIMVKFCLLVRAVLAVSGVITLWMRVHWRPMVVLPCRRC